jgi:hypothetical protein
LLPAAKTKAVFFGEKMNSTNTHQVIFHNPTGRAIDRSGDWLTKTENTKAGKVTHVFERESKDNASKMDKFLTKVGALFSGIKKAEKSSTLAKLSQKLDPSANSRFGLKKYNPNILMRNIKTMQDQSLSKDRENKADPFNATLNETLTAGKYEIKIDNTVYKP